MTLGLISRPATLFAAILFITAQAHAARPFATDDAGIGSAATFELETAADGGRDQFSPGFCLKHGLTPRMDIGFSAAHQTLPEIERAFSPAELGLKYGIIPDVLACSFSAAFSDPAYSANLIFSHGLNNWTIHANLGYEAVGGTRESAICYGLCPCIEIGRVTTGLEICGNHTALPDWRLGSQCRICEWCSIDAGIGGGLGRDAHLTATTGLWFAFPLARTGRTQPDPTM